MSGYALPRFREDAVCPKCLGTDIHARYEEGCGGHKGCERHPEKIERYCRRCSYRWDEAPVDTPSSAGAHAHG